MDTSVTIIGLLITILIAIPLYFVFRGNSINKNRIKAIQSLHNPDNTIDFKESDAQNKKVFSIDKKNKIFLFIDFNPKETFSKLIELKKIIHLKMLYTINEETHKAEKIELEFTYKKENQKVNLIVYDSKFDPMNQVCLFEDEKLAKNWTQKINVLLG